MGKCDKCHDSDARHRYHFGYVAIEGGSRWLRYWMLCTVCLENATIANEGKQHPLWYFRTTPLVDENGEQVVINGEKKWENKLERSDKTLWPESVKGKTYGNSLTHPSAARSAIDNI